MIDMFEFYFLIVFYIVFIGRSVMLALNGINPFALVKGKTGVRALVEVLFIPGLLFWSWEVLRHSRNIDIYLLPELMYKKAHLPFLFTVLGIFLTVAGFVLFILALVAFGGSWRVGIDREKPGKLVTDGVFKVSRNPIFLFINMYFGGTFLVYPNLLFGVSFFIVAGLVHLQIIQEEDHLKHIYKEEYKEYMEEAPRYLWKF